MVRRRRAAAPGASSAPCSGSGGGGGVGGSVGIPDPSGCPPSRPPPPSGLPGGRFGSGADGSVMVAFFAGASVPGEHPPVLGHRAAAPARPAQHRLIARARASGHGRGRASPGDRAQPACAVIRAGHQVGGLARAGAGDSSVVVALDPFRVLLADPRASKIDAASTGTCRRRRVWTTSAGTAMRPRCGAPPGVAVRAAPHRQPGPQRAVGGDAEGAPVAPSGITTEASAGRAVRWVEAGVGEAEVGPRAVHVEVTVERRRRAESVELGVGPLR